MRASKLYQIGEIKALPPKMSMPTKIFWGNRGVFDLDILKNDVLETENYKFQLIPFIGHKYGKFGNTR